MRVLTIVGDFGIGGTQRVAQNMTLGVQRVGPDTAVFAYREGGARESIYREHGVPVFFGSPLEKSLADAVAWRPDIVHVHRSGYPNATETQIMSALREAGARVVETNVFARYDRSEARHLIDVHCLLTRWCQFKWTCWRPNEDGSCSTILPNAVEIASFTPMATTTCDTTRAELGIPPKRFLFGRIGQPIEAKWSPAIFEAFARACAQGGDIGLLLIGAPASYVDRAKVLAPDIRDRIIMLDPIADDNRLRALFSAMDAFLHLALIGESFGMVLCEAMLCGTPVITLSTPLKDNSQLEVVGHEQGGLIALDLNGVVEAMHRIRTDDALRAAIIARSPSWVAERFSVERVSMMALRIYQALLAGGGTVAVQRRLDEFGEPPPDYSWIRAIQCKGLGSPPGLATRLAMQVLHKAAVYGAYQSTRATFARWRG